MINLKAIYLFHALIVGPFLFYIGYMGIKTPEEVFKILMITGLVVILYHAYMYYKLAIL
jgi:hypothetical protein